MILDKKVGNKRFTVYDSEANTVLELINELGTITNDVQDSLDNKTDLHGNHLGAWQGLNKPTMSEEGMRATVEHINEVEIPYIKGQLNDLSIGNPIFYGADPSGTKPSSDAINQCIIANKGKSVKFSPGKYLLDKPILTPYYVEEQVNIDFSGSLLYTEEPLDYVIGVGFCNSGADKPNHDNYTRESCYALLHNFVINAPNTRIGIITKDYYWYPRIKDCTIFNTKIGIQLGTITNEGWSSDLYLENAFIQCKSYKDNDTVGIIINGSDNKISNCRVYNCFKGMINNGSGNILTNIHFYLYGHLNERQTEEFITIYPQTIAIIDNGNSNMYDKIYTDSYSTHFKATTTNYKGKFTKCKLYSNVTGFDDIAFDFSSSSNVQYLNISNCDINLRDAGVNGNIGLKVSTSQRADDMCLNWDICENRTNYILNDLILIDRNKNYVFPFSGAYKLLSNVYYIVGYIPVVANMHSYTVNITGTGSTKQRGRYYINGSGVLSEINNEGVTGSDYGIGGKIVTLNDNRKYIEVSIMTKYEKYATLGIQFDCNIDGFNYGILPIYERHMHGNPNSKTTTPTITQTFSN